MHLSGDFPDPIDFFKTRVIESFVDLTSTSFEHTVFSINRVPPSPAAMAKDVIFSAPLAIRTKQFGYGTAVEYDAPGKGVQHKSKLIELGDWLADRIAAFKHKPQLLVGHKLTIEGIAIYRAALRLGIPYAITIQSHTDDKILRARHDLRPLFAQIYHAAKMVVCFTPVARDKIDAKLRRRDGPTYIIPCATDLDAPLEPKASGHGLISVFHLKNFRNKNLAGMVEGLKIANQSGVNLALELVGGGESQDITACKTLTGEDPNICLLGPMDRDNVRNQMNRAQAFVMPSLSESFGLVFIEALFSGIPIIYPTRTAIDGYFDRCDFAIPVDPRNPKAIADAMIHVTKHEEALKRSLAHWHKSEQARRFTRPSISDDYRRALSIAASSTH